LSQAPAARPPPLTLPSTPTPHPQLPDLQTVLAAGLGRSRASKVVPGPTGPLVAGTETAKITLNFKLPKGVPGDYSNALDPLPTGGLPYALRFGPGTKALVAGGGLFLNANAKIKVPKRPPVPLKLPGNYTLYVITSGSVAIGVRAAGGARRARASVAGGASSRVGRQGRARASRATTEGARPARAMRPHGASRL
jgi:hypothetical protein